MTTKAIALSDKEIGFAQRVTAGMAKHDAYRASFPESSGFTLEECKREANKLCRTSRVKAALTPNQSAEKWQAVFGLEMAQLQSIIEKSMQPQYQYNEDGEKIPGSETYPDMGCALAAIKQRTDIKMEFYGRTKRLARIEKTLRMKEKGLVADAALMQMIRSELA